MKVKNDFKWVRVFSADPLPVNIPAGAPVEYHKANNCFYVCPSFFKDDVILKHDAAYYGCRVPSDNVEE
jgi:hypothetical protein